MEEAPLQSVQSPNVSRHCKPHNNKKCGVSTIITDQKKMKTTQLFVFLTTVFMFQYTSTALALNKTSINPPLTNVYYLATQGTAILTNGKTISGKFYYSSPLLSDSDVFYFYSGSTSSKEIIPITNVKEISFGKKDGLEYTYFLENGALIRSLQNGAKEKLNTRILRTIKKSIQQK